MDERSLHWIVGRLRCYDVGRALMETAQLLGNFGKFIGAIAVVATLVYLAIQVKHSEGALEANIRALDEPTILLKLLSAHVLLFRSRFDRS